MKIKFSVTFVTVLVVGALFGCSPKVQVHGYMPLSSNIVALKPGVSTKSDVVQLIGTPAFINTFADNRWHYVAYKTEQIGFWEPKILQYDVLQLVFDEEQILEEMRRGDKTALVALQHDKEVTPSSGREMTVMEQLIGNIGRFTE